MIDCPICGRALDVTRHHRREWWTAQQLWLINKLRANGISQKAIARLMGCHAQTIAKLVSQPRSARVPNEKSEPKDARVS